MRWLVGGFLVLMAIGWWMQSRPVRQEPYLPFPTTVWTPPETIPTTTIPTTTIPDCDRFQTATTRSRFSLAGPCVIR